MLLPDIGLMKNLAYCRSVQLELEINSLTISQKSDFGEKYIPSLISYLPGKILMMFPSNCLIIPFLNNYEIS